MKAPAVTVLEECAKHAEIRTMPTVSVVIPTFNRSKLVVRAIDSVLNQTYKDYEIIVVDDGSTDNTSSILKPYTGRVRYFYQENQGPSAAKNKGIQLARGKWISILDSDDLWLPTKLELQLNTVTALGRDFGACFTNCSFFGDPNLVMSGFEQAGLCDDTADGPFPSPLKFILARHPAIYFQSLLVLRSLMEQLNGFDEDLRVAEDTDLLFRLAFKTRFCFVNQPAVTINRSQSREGLMELFSQRDERVFRSLEHMFRKWICLPENVDQEVRQTIHQRLKRLYYDWLIAKLYRFRCADAFEIARKIRATGDDSRKMWATLVFRAKRKLSSVLKKLWNNHKGACWISAGLFDLD
jgi:glycosyltransferase involved in cell wall biosynthesis